jgi:hypothetical protein
MMNSIFAIGFVQTLKSRNYAVEACEDGQTALSLLEGGTTV